MAACTLVLLVECHRVSSACECGEKNAFEVEFVQARAVFAGEVTDVTFVNRGISVTFRRDKTWKGELGDTVVLTNGLGCAFPFQKGERYLVYVFGNSVLGTSRCSRTMPTAYAFDDRERLNDTGWSQIVRGIRARMHVLPPKDPTAKRYTVFLELQNVGEHQTTVRLRPDRLDFQVLNAKDHKPIQQTEASGYSVFIPEEWSLLIPGSGSMKVPISFTRTGTPNEEPILEITPENRWAIQGSNSFLLKGKITVSPRKNDHPYLDWSGTLELPYVRIPALPRPSP